MNDTQCVFLDFDQVKEDYPDRVDGADCSSATVKPGEHFGEYVVQRENGSGNVHKPVIARDGGHFYGRCTCKGWKHHEGPCSHLIILRKLAVTNDVVIPNADDVDEIRTLRASDDESENEQPDSSDETTDDQDDESDDGVTIEYDESDVDESDGATDDDVEQAIEEAPEPPEREPPAGAIDDSLENQYPRVYHEHVHTADDGTEYITKQGLEKVAKREGLDVEPEPLSPTWDGDRDVAAWRGVVYDGDRKVTDVGTAHLEHEDAPFAESNLDEFASNRATNRAIRRATGISLVSSDEIDVDDAHDHDVEKAMRADRRTA